MTNKRNCSLQLFRIMACLGVFCVHFGQRIELEGTLRSFTSFGLYGVHMFFIISGLLAAKGLDGQKDTIEFYKKRIISIAPLYYLTILWYFVTENVLQLFWPHIPEDPTGIGWFRYLFLLNGFVRSDVTFWSNLGITWTIPIFAFFYLIAPLVMKFIKGYKSAFASLILVLILTTFAIHVYKCPISNSLYYFFIGILIYFCWRDDRLMPCALGFLVTAIVEIIIGRACYPALFASMICIGLEKEFLLPDKIQRIVDIVDEHTYTLYLVHGMVFCSLLDRLKANRFNTPRSVIGLIAIVGTFLGTVIIHRFFEKPIQKMLRRRLLKKEKAE